MRRSTRPLSACVNVHPSHMSALQWWNGRRLKYNIALAVAGLVAFITYATLVCSFAETFPDRGITGFTSIFHGMGFLLVMVVANVCYFLGPLSESLLQPDDRLRYRETAYALGFWFSVALPFVFPALVLIIIIRST